MAILPNNETMAFSMPGGEASDPVRVRPIDLQHLSRQTMGDRDLEREVLGLFAEQAQTVRKLTAFHDGDAVGTVTDFIWSPRLEKNIGYVWMPIGLTEPGIALEVEAPDGGRWAASTAAIPFLDAKKQVPLGKGAPAA